MSGSGPRLRKANPTVKEAVAEFNEKLDKLERIREFKPDEAMAKLVHMTKAIDLETISPFDALNLLNRNWDIQYDILLDHYIRNEHPESFLDQPEIPPNIYLRGRDLFRQLKHIEKYNLDDPSMKDDVHALLDEADTHESIQDPVYGFIYQSGLELVDKIDEYEANQHIKRLGREVAEKEPSAPKLRKELTWKAPTGRQEVLRSIRRAEPDAQYHKLHNTDLMDVGTDEDDPYAGWGPVPTNAISRLQCRERPNEHTLMLVQDNKTFTPDMEAAKDIMEAKIYECLMEGLCKVSFQYVKPEEFLKGCPPLCWQGATSAADTPEEHFNLNNPSYTRIRGRLMRGEEIDPVWLDKTKPWGSQWDKSCPVWCHEGRHRAMTAMKEGIKLIPAVVVEPNDEAKQVFYEQCNRIKQERRVKLQRDREEF